jgi:hypothetical protein
VQQFLFIPSCKGCINNFRIDYLVPYRQYKTRAAGAYVLICPFIESPSCFQNKFASGQKVSVSKKEGFVETGMICTRQWLNYN